VSAEPSERQPVAWPRATNLGAVGRANSLLVVLVLVIDAVLLAMMELMFLSLALGSIPLPISALVALLSTPWLVRRAGEVSGSFGASAPLVAWVLAVAVLGLAGPGGDALLLGDWSSLLFLGAGLLPAAFVLGRVLRANRDEGSAGR
jgi:hypothetical protein